jgi:endonuclease/exonuclease/phosphatase family protein
VHLTELAASADPVPSARPRTLRQLAYRIRWERGRQGTGPLGLRALLRTMGAASLRGACTAIDAANPPTGLAAAYTRIGYPIGGGTTALPPGPVSLAAINRRLGSRETVTLNCLSYNTYLLQGLQVPIGRWIDDAVGWDALSWFGVPAGGALLVLLGVSSIPGVAIFTILELAGFTPSTVIKQVTGIDLDGIRISPKPALEARASELGTAIAGYDLCCLCEVWTEDSQRRLLETLAGAGSTGWSHEAGPDGSGDWTLAGSGLYFLVRNHPIVATERHVFSERGSRLHDSDAWSKKGIMLNVIDLGFGRLELFQTHLYYGGGIPVLSEPTDADRLTVWRSELGELAAFIRDHHAPQNVAVLTGDFNMSGADMRIYPEIRKAVDPLGLHDAWAWEVFGHDPSQGLTCRFTDGDESAWNRTFDTVCAYRNQNGLSDPWREYCGDDVIHPVPPRGVGRYDYVFVERPTAAHSYTLDLSRPLRRPFPRQATTESEGYLSDHLGVDLTFYCTRK